MAMEILGINVSLSSSVTIVITVVILSLSTVYTFRNILRIWRKGQPKPVTTDATQEDDVASAAAPTDSVEENPAKPAGVVSEIDSEDNGGVNLDDIDPVEYCEHIQSEVKKAKQRVTTKKIVEELTPEQVKEELEIQQQQLQNIFQLMQTQNEKFGVNSLDEVQQQMKLYA
ncbi:uncharacterized protein LOC132551247 [Ylistrum balloti]|uniref:uncharacterized protein LOC132551247 n=1 Tax=Ylistrum balloti TaxID=509963 RepID=UPI002905EA1C|nr:uncharacterized protein LOC132551247 [Ylistrum balloti]